MRVYFLQTLLCIPVVFCALFSGCSMRADNKVLGNRTYIRTEPAKNWGYISRQGNFVIKPQFDAADEFRNGSAVVRTVDTATVHKFRIDRTGTPFKLEATSAFDVNERGDYFDDIALAKLSTFGGNYGLITKNGKLVRKLKIHPDSLNFSEGLVPIKLNNKLGYMNTAGDIVIIPHYQMVRPFHEGLAAVLSDGKWGYIDKSDRLTIPFKFSMAKDFHEGVAVVHDGNDLSTTFTFINKTGRPKLEVANSKHVTDFGEGLAGVTYTDGTVAAINHEGKKAFTISRCKDIGEFHDGLSYAATSNTSPSLYGYLNRNGEWAIQPQFLHAGNFSESLAPACKYDKNQMSQVHNEAHKQK